MGFWMTASHQLKEDQIMIHYIYNETNSPFREKCYLGYASNRDKISSYILAGIVTFGAIVALYTLLFSLE